MDVVRAPKSKRTRNAAIGAGVLLLTVVTVALARLGPASPTVDGSTLFTDSVRRGDMVREVRGPGTLVPEHIRWITAQASARVERLVAVSGQSVTPDGVLLEMSNPDLQIQTMQADQQVRQAQIDLLNLKTNLQSQRLTQEGTVANMKTQNVTAQQEMQAAEQLEKQRLMAAFEVNTKKAQASEITTRLRIEQERLALMNAAIDSQIATQSAQVLQLKAIAANQRNRLQSLTVRAPEAGVLQDLTLQLGQWVPEGTTLAKVVQPGKLKAVLRIPESQAKDVQVGQVASIDTRNGLVQGHVSRKDPSAQAGTVTIDVALDGALPAGAVPDLSVDGTIQIERLKNVLFTGRPTSGTGTGMVALFRITEGGKAAERVQVVLGRSSVNTVEIIKGLQLGDRVILSDMSNWDSSNRVRLK
ncbi:MAG: secretion protein HlyD family protein [Gemmatimonadetes bacterium]|nr:secretion protein HlyD family protein [Gemmatimonadota bacterium]